MTRSVKLHTKKDTEDLAKKISLKIKVGDVLALYGELGVGKTFFTQRLCSFLGVKENVTSPSFTLMNEYKGNFPIAHIDLYRLSSPEEVLELGLYDLFENKLTIIEWPEAAENLLPPKTISLIFYFENSHRKVEIKNLV